MKASLLEPSVASILFSFASLFSYMRLLLVSAPLSCLLAGVDNIPSKVFFFCVI